MSGAWRKAALLASAALALALFPSPVQPARAEGDVREVLLRVLVVRVGSGFAPGAAVDVLREGDRVTVLVREDGRGIVKARTASGEVGMIPACFLRPVYGASAPAAEEPETLSGNGVVTAPAVNFRMTPRIDQNNLLTPLRKDARVRLLSREGYYYRVERDDGTVGYVSMRNVERLPENVDEPAVPAGPVLPEPEPEPEPAVCTVTASALRLRSGPSIASAQIGWLRRGDRVTLVEEAGDFCRVRTADGLEGYASAKYLDIEYPAPVAPKPGADAFFELIKRVNFRSSPEISEGNVLGRLEAGTVVRFIDASGDFWKVELEDGRTGYCASDYLRQTDKSFD